MPEPSQGLDIYNKPAAPSFVDIAVEAVHTLSDARGSSLSAIVAWVRDSHYGHVLNTEDARFKANFAVGVKEVSFILSCARVTV